MKTAHQFARELLAGPDLPISHFDPSRAGTDPDRDTSIAEPTVERTVLDADEIAAADEEGRPVLTDFLTINGDTDEAGEATKTPRITVICNGQGDAVISLKRIAPNQFQARPMSQDDDFGLKVCPGDVLEIN